MNSYEFLTPGIITYGTGSLESIKKHAQNFGSRALVITDKIIVDTGIAQQTVDLLKQSGIYVELYEGIDSEPTDKHISEGVKIVKQGRFDMVIGVGGGSCIDAAKAVAIMAANQGQIKELMGIDKIKNKPLPLLAVPTTAGTGTEVTKAVIITNTEDNVKMLIMDPLAIPRVAVVDPLLTLTLPPDITAYTGIDALTHAIEAFISRKAQPLTDALALSAIKLLSTFLPTAFKEGSNIEARNNCMTGSLKAGMAFSNSSVALVHGMSRPLGAYFHLPHGLSNALLLPLIMEWTVLYAPQKFSAVAKAMGHTAEECSEEEIAQKAVTAVQELCRKLKVPSIKNLGLDREKLQQFSPVMAEDALQSGSPANNPRTPTKQDIIELYLRL